MSEDNVVPINSNIVIEEDDDANFLVDPENHVGVINANGKLLVTSVIRLDEEDTIGSVSRCLILTEKMMECPWDELYEKGWRTTVVKLYYELLE